MRRLLLTIKMDPKRKVESFEDPTGSKRCTQIISSDYNDIVLFPIIVYGCYKKLASVQPDIKNVFFHGDLEEKTYMELINPMKRKPQIERERLSWQVS